MDKQHLSPGALCQLSQEYLKHAHKASQNVTSENQLKDYYKLITMSIQCLRYLKSNYPLSIAQDAEITYRLTEILLEETFNFDLAESYISSIRERLKHHLTSTSNWPILQEKMRCEFVALYILPMRRDDKFHYKIALRHCDELVQFLANWKYDNELTKWWLLLFQYVSIWLNTKLGNVRRVLSQFEDLSNTGQGSIQWRSFITLCHLNFYLNQRLSVPKKLSEQVSTLKCDQIGPKLYGWKLVLELIIQVYEDRNVTEKLNDFKQLFTEHKDSLNDNQDCISVEIHPNVTLNINLSSIFQYRDLKNILLLLQSVSYLVNCYDKKANFSSKFLPKVFSTTEKLISTVTSTGTKSLSYYNSKIEFYKSTQKLTEFYQIWEKMLLTGELRNLEGKNFGNPDYSVMLSAIAHQINSGGNSSSICDEYNALIHLKRTSSEVKMIALLNSYALRTSLISKGIQTEEQLSQCNALWSQIENNLKISDLHSNATWDCTVTVLWIISHFEPFTSNPLPSSDGERSLYIEKLKLYYSNNKLIKSEVDSQVGEKNQYKVKKSVLMQVLLNYVGGRLFEQDLMVITQISAACFRLSRQQKFPILDYVVGLWHLMNSTIAMKSKDVVLITAKLDAIVNQLSTDLTHSI